VRCCARPTRVKSLSSSFPVSGIGCSKAGIQYLLLLRERGLLSGHHRHRGARIPMPGSARSSLLNPLLRTAAKSMEAVILYETSRSTKPPGSITSAYFKQALGTEIRRADRYQQPCTLITFEH